MDTGWPTTDGSGRLDVIVVVVGMEVAVLTVCAVGGEEELPMKFASPVYVAVRFLTPVVVKVIEQLPVATLAVQLCVQSVTVTLPVSVVALPGAVTVTLIIIVTGWPAADGLGRWDVIVIAVLALLTLCDDAGLTLLLKFASPAYVAVRFLAPAVAKAIEQLPVPTARLPVQLCVPSETVTLPVGVPLPGAITATLKLMGTA